jgi:hypothetical protein
MVRSSRRNLAGVLAGIAVGFPLTISTGCVTGREFRAAAGPAVQQGLALILDGVVDGLFAVVEPEPETTGGN